MNAAASRNRQAWHTIPLLLGSLLCSISLIVCPQASCRYPSDLQGNGDQYLRVIFAQLSSFLILVLPCAVLSLACFIQTVDMDYRYIQELKQYKNEGITVDGVLAEAPNNSKNCFLTRYRYGDYFITKVIKLVDEKEKSHLMTESIIPLVILPPNERSAIAQSWLEEQLQDRTSLKRRVVHLGGTVYGAGFYFLLPQIFMLEDPRNLPVMLGLFILAIPMVHVYLLNRYDSFVKSYLQASDLTVAAYGIPVVHSL